MCPLGAMVASQRCSAPWAPHDATRPAATSASRSRSLLGISGWAGLTRQAGGRGGVRASYEGGQPASTKSLGRMLRGGAGWALALEEPFAPTPTLPFHPRNPQKGRTFGAHQLHYPMGQTRRTKMFEQRFESVQMPAGSALTRITATVERCACGGGGRRGATQPRQPRVTTWR